MKTKSTAKKKAKYGKAHAAPRTRKQLDDRDLNEDEQNRRTNAPEDVEDSYRSRSHDNDVEEEEERERKRRVDDARGEEEN